MPLLLIGGKPLLIICMIQVERLIEKFGGLLSSSHWYLEICITILLMIYF
jgi:hypothetical protein